MSRRTFEVQCEECPVVYLSRGRKPGKDGKFRCALCRNRKQRQVFTEKHGLTPYEKYFKGTKRGADNRRAWQLRQYGITLSDLRQMEETQGGLCAICERGPDYGRTALVVDHDHLTGRTRSLLCNRCNLLLGKVQDSPDLLEKAASYLRKSRV